MKKYMIQYVGSVPEKIKKDLYSKLPKGFELEFLDEKKDPNERNASLKKVDFILGFPRGFTEEMQITSHLKLVQLLSAGFDGFDVEKATELGFPVANNGGANSIAVAEHSILLILALYKKLIQYCAGKRDKDHPVRLYELTGKKVGIVGFGNIGKALARRLKGFDTILSYYDVIRSKDVENEIGIKYCTLEEILTESDIVSLHVPLLKSTVKMIGKKELEMMKETAILINTARGELIDEDALYQALKNNRIAGAGLDVLERERDVARGTYVSPLSSLDNVLITPHYAGHTYDTFLRRIEIGYANIVRTANGEKPKYVVNV